MKTVAQHKQTLATLAPAKFLEMHYGINGAILKANKRANPHFAIVEAIEELAPTMLALYNTAPPESVKLSSFKVTTYLEDLQQDPKVLAGTHRVEVSSEKCGGKGQRVQSYKLVRAES